MTWILVWSDRALKDLDRLDQRTRERIVNAMERLAETGYGDLKRLRGQGREWRLRSGDWRVRLDLEPESRTVRVFRVRHRREAYR